MHSASIRPGTGARTPAVRGQYMQMFAAHIGRLPQEDRHAISSVLPEAVWQQIESAGVFGWLPIEVNLVCTRAVAESLGKERTHQFFRSLLLDAMRSHLLRALVDGVLRVAVRDVGLYLTWVGKGFDLMFRDVGRWDVIERVPGRAVLRLSGLAPECIRDEIWIQSLASAMCAFEDLVGVTGKTTVQSIDVEGRRVLFAGEWS